MSIKLASFHGMPVTQTIGFTYLTYFVLTELLNLIYSMKKPSTDVNAHGDIVGSHGQNFNFQPYQDLDKVLSRNEEFMGLTSIIFQSFASCIFICYTCSLKILEKNGTDWFYARVYSLGVAWQMLVRLIRISPGCLPLTADLCRQYPRLGENLLLMDPKTVSRRESEFDKITAAFMFSFS